MKRAGREHSREIIRERCSRETYENRAGSIAESWGGPPGTYHGGTVPTARGWTGGASAEPVAVSAPACSLAERSA